ncbi:hypothetical protein O1L68_17605 [Streptomyces lydicus]|nr:hypothetical protein [Streptomyces lydicus]
MLCEHDAATAVLGEVLALAERHHGRRPADRGRHRSWLYALARWACLRRLAEGTGPAAKALDPTAAATGPAAAMAETPGPAAAEADRRQRELAALALAGGRRHPPRAARGAGASVRHQLSADEVAAVLGTDPVATRALLATASCEVERTRAALAVVESGRCREVAQLAGDTQMLLGAALSRELVRHVDDCAECRRTAERATALGTWPGTAPVSWGRCRWSPRPVRPCSARWRRPGAPSRAARRAWPVRHTAAGPVGQTVLLAMTATDFHRPPTDRVARRRRFRGRALTTTVVATVVAAPVLALWAAYHGSLATDEAADASPSVTASDTQTGDRGERLGGRPYENAGNAWTTPDPGFRAGEGRPMCPSR